MIKVVEKIQKGSINRGVAGLFKNPNAECLKSEAELRSIASLKSSKQNKKRSRKVLPAISTCVNSGEPKVFAALRHVLH